MFAWKVLNFTSVYSSRFKGAVSNSGARRAIVEPHSQVVELQLLWIAGSNMIDC